jgi:hypothetical protein
MMLVQKLHAQRLANATPEVSIAKRRESKAVFEHGPGIASK